MQAIQANNAVIRVVARDAKLEARIDAINARCYDSIEHGLIPTRQVTLVSESLTDLPTVNEALRVLFTTPLEALFGGDARTQATALAGTTIDVDVPKTIVSVRRIGYNLQRLVSHWHSWQLHESEFTAKLGTTLTGHQCNPLFVATSHIYGPALIAVQDGGVDQMSHSVTELEKVIARGYTVSLPQSLMTSGDESTDTACFAITTPTLTHLSGFADKVRHLHDLSP